MTVLLLGMVSQWAYATELSVTGRANVKLKADQAQLSVLAISESPTPLKAKQLADAKASHVRNAIENIAGVKVTDGQIVIRPYYKTDSNRERKLVGYRAQRPLQVHLNQLTHLNQVLQRSFAKGGDEIINIHYDSSKRHAAMNKLRIKALHNGQQIARQYAKALGKKVSEVVAITYNNPPISLPDQRLETYKMSSVSSQYQSAAIELSDSVALKFTLK